MNKRVVYSYFTSDESRFIADYLHKNHGWDPVFFHGIKQPQWIKEDYSNAVFGDSTAIRQSNFDYSKIGKPVPLDASIIEALSKYESNYLNWLEDTSGWNFSFAQRRRYYYDVLKFWNTVIQYLKPDIFVAYTWPHLPSDYPFYLLCKHYYKIPVVFLNPMPFLDNDYYVVGDSMEELSSPFDHLYRSADPLEISNDVKEYLKRLRSLKPATPRHVAHYWQKLDMRYKARYRELLGFLKSAIKGKSFQKSFASFKKNTDPWESDSSKLNNLEEFLFRWTLARRNQELRDFYNQMAAPADCTVKYIYFPAPYQPEVFSNLSAGAYEDVFLILDMLSDVIPEDWQIYYKEHPNTFKESDKGGLTRSKEFYKKINSYKNIQIIPFEEDTFKLIDHSQAVCTVGGTAGWEAMVRSKPALVYGNIWYQSCKSVFMIKTRDDAFKAMKQIIDGFCPDEKDVDRYAEAIYRSRTCEYGLVDEGDYRKRIEECPDPKYAMERTAKAFYDAFEFYYGIKKIDNQGSKNVRSSHENLYR